MTPGFPLLTTNSSFFSHESRPVFAAEQRPLDSCQQELQSPEATFNLVLFSILSEKAQRVAKSRSMCEVLSLTSNIMFKKPTESVW